MVKQWDLAAKFYNNGHDDRSERELSQHDHVTTYLSFIKGPMVIIKTLSMEDRYDIAIGIFSKITEKKHPGSVFGQDKCTR